MTSIPPYETSNDSTSSLTSDSSQSADRLRTTSQQYETTYDPVVERFWLALSEQVSDPDWSRVFRDAADGIYPPGFYYNNGKFYHELPGSKRTWVALSRGKDAYKKCRDFMRKHATPPLTEQATNDDSSVGQVDTSSQPNPSILTGWEAIVASQASAGRHGTASGKGTDKKKDKRSEWTMAKKDERKIYYLAHYADKLEERYSLTKGERAQLWHHLCTLALLGDLKADNVKFVEGNYEIEHISCISFDPDTRQFTVVDTTPVKGTGRRTAAKAGGRAATAASTRAKGNTTRGRGANKAAVS